MYPRTEELAGLTEDEFRQNVLIPLLAAMGYRDVEHYHGRNELGKDIVAWHEAPDGTRENVAVVAKRGRVSATASGDVNTIATQVRQAYGSSFIAKTGGEEYRVHKVIVAASGSIDADARRAIDAAIADTNISRQVGYWPVGQVQDLLKRYLPHPLIPKQLEHIRQRLGDLQVFKVEPTLEAQRIIYRVEPRDGDAKIADISFTFPDTEEGRAVRERVRQFFEHGLDVTVPGEFIARFDTHEELEQLFGGDKPVTIEMGSKPAQEPLLAKLVVKPKKGDVFQYDGLRLLRVRAGSKSAEYRTTDDEDALELRITHSKQGDLRVMFKFDIADKLVFQTLRVAQLWSLIADGARIELRGSKTNELILDGKAPVGIEHPDGALIQLLEDLDFIQTQTNHVLTLPRELTSDLVENTTIMRRAIEEGAFTLPFESVQMTVNSRQARYFLKEFAGDEEKRIALTAEGASYSLCDKEIQLGDLVRIMDPVYMTDDDRRRTERSLAGGGDEHPIRLHAAPDCSGARFYFVDYLRGEALDEYNRTFGDVKKNEPDWELLEEG